MKRAVLYAPGQLVVEDAAVPDVGPGMVGIAGRIAVICGRMHIYMAGSRRESAGDGHDYQDVLRKSAPG